MSKIDLTGSCLCGSVRYKISGEQHKFWHCHCSRCRKSSGTGHASNVLVKHDSADWLEGESLVTRYKVPNARFFGTAFCSLCGSQLPRFGSDRDIAVIPAGSLDHAIELRPDGRIFGGSRTPWSCSDGELPCHDTYPSG